MILQILVSFFLVFASDFTSGHPAPQTSDKDQTYDDYYGDYDEASKAATPTSDNGLVDLLKTGTSLAQGFLALLGEKVKFVNTVLADQELRDRVGSTVSTGLNLTGQISRVAVPLVGTLAAQVPTLINTSRAVLQSLNNEDNQQRIRQVAGAGSRVAQGVGAAASQTPELIVQGSRLAGSVIKAANDTAPLVINGIQEFTDQLPLIAGFASAYAEVNAEQTQKVVQTFYTSLQCDLQCKDIVDKDLKQECMVQFCTKKENEDI